MRSIVRTSMFLLGIALLGSIVTAAIYLILAVVAVALLLGGMFLLMGRRWDGRRRERLEEFEREQREGVRFGDLPDDVFETDVSIPPIPEDMRDPAWRAAVEKRAEQRHTLIRKCLAVTGRVGPAHPDEEGYAEWMTVRDLCYKVFGTIPREVGRFTSSDGTLNHTTYNVEVEPPAKEVLHVDRPFRLVTDCRYGHAAEHHIVGVTGLAGEGFRKLYADQPKGRIIRECVCCEPSTRWTERP